MDSSQQPISVVIPTYNGRAKIGKLLYSLEQQTYQEFETIVVIDGSTDGTEEYLHSREWQLQDLRVISQENQGRAEVRNRGAREAKGRFLIFYDDDIILPSENVRIYLNALLEEPQVIFSGQTLHYFKEGMGDFSKYLRSLTEKWFQKALDNQSSDFLTAANFGIAKDLFFKMGGFDKRLQDAEDYDFARRAVEKSFVIQLLPEALAWHDEPYTCRQYILRQRQYLSSHHELEAHRKPPVDPYVGSIKHWIYAFFSKRFWLKNIDKEVFAFLPTKLRFKIYDIVIEGLSKHYAHRDI